MTDTTKVTVLKRAENGKLKSLLISNETNEQARLYFSDEEKLTRMVVSNDSSALVAFDRVGLKYAIDPLTPGFLHNPLSADLYPNSDQDKDKNWCFLENHPSKNDLLIYIKDAHGNWGQYEGGEWRPFISINLNGISFSSESGKPQNEVYIHLRQDGKISEISTPSTCTVIEQNTTTDAPAPQAKNLLMQKELDKRRSR